MHHGYLSTVSFLLWDQVSWTTTPNGSFQEIASPRKADRKDQCMGVLVSPCFVLITTHYIYLKM